jgi:NTE family protein
LVLSGGGLKGLSHIGVFQALEERGLFPTLVVGCSMGSLIAAAWAAGWSIDNMRTRAMRIRRKDVFRVAHADMAFRRMGAPAVYRREPLFGLIESIVGDMTFEQLPRRLVINTVNIDNGMQVLWGTQGLQDVPVADAVFASCALPGLFPPRSIRGGRYCDGALVTNLPVRAALALGNAPVIAVDVGASLNARAPEEDIGFVGTYVRGLEIVMRTILDGAARHWAGQPVLLVGPKVAHVSMFSFDHTAEIIEEGYRATITALDGFAERLFEDPPAIYPQRVVDVTVDPQRCIGCGACVMRAPEVFRMSRSGLAEVVAPRQQWSPFDGDYVFNCPTGAIGAESVPGQDA